MLTMGTASMNMKQEWKGQLTWAISCLFHVSKVMKQRRSHVGLVQGQTRGAWEQRGPHSEGRWLLDALSGSSGNLATSAITINSNISLMTALVSTSKVDPSFYFLRSNTVDALASARLPNKIVTFSLLLHICIYGFLPFFCAPTAMSLPAPPLPFPPPLIISMTWQSALFGALLQTIYMCVPQPLLRASHCIIVSANFPPLAHCIMVCL